MNLKIALAAHKHFYLRLVSSRANLLLTILLGSSCSSENEPIFHLFEHSSSYPEYNEIKHLQEQGFDTKLFSDTFYITKLNADVQLRFMLDKDKTEILSKVTRVYVDKLDTLIAESVIENFNGKKDSQWRKIDDKKYTIFVQYKNDRQALLLGMEENKSFVETRSDFFHRITH